MCFLKASRLKNFVYIKKPTKWVSFLLLGIIFFSSSNSSATSPFQGFKNNLSPSSNIKIIAIADPERINPKGRFVLHIKIEVKRGWHIYSLNAEGDEGESLATRITLNSDLFVPQGHWKEPSPTIEWDGALEKVVKTHKQTVEFNRWYRAIETLNPGSYRVKGSVVLRACNNKICNLPSEILFNADIELLSEAS